MGTTLRTEDRLKTNALRFVESVAIGRAEDQKRRNVIFICRVSLYERKGKYAPFISFRNLLTKWLEFQIVLHGTMDLSLSGSETKTAAPRQ